MSSLNLIFIKSTRNAELLSIFTTLRQMTYLEIENCFAEVEM